MARKSTELVKIDVDKLNALIKSKDITAYEIAQMMGREPGIIAHIKHKGYCDVYLYSGLVKLLGGKFELSESTNESVPKDDTSNEITMYLLYELRRHTELLQKTLQSVDELLVEVKKFNS